jgi:hypothetical protein
MAYAPVAQLDRASGFEPEGREFESLRARHTNPSHLFRLSSNRDFNLLRIVTDITDNWIFQYEA